MAMKAVFVVVHVNNHLCLFATLIIPFVGKYVDLVGFPSSKIAYSELLSKRLYKRLVVTGDNILLFNNFSERGDIIKHDK